MQKLRVGIIGAGRIGQVHAKSITYHIPQAEIVAISDLFPENAQKVADDLGIPKAVQPGDYDLVYNTVPHMIFTKRELQALRRDTVLVDLASFPGGVDTLMAHTLGITVVDGRNLPGRTAPETAGALIGETVAEMIEEGLE